MSRRYRVQEFARLAGVTVRALHHYDRLGLLRPVRTDSGYRLYSIRDLERLEQIVALKFLGIPLKRIGDLLGGNKRKLSDVLRSQRRALEEKRRRLDQTIRAVREAESEPDAAALRKIIEVIEMQDNADFVGKYYSEEARAKISKRAEQWTPEMQAEISRKWNDLFRDVEASLHEDPAGDKAQALAARWRTLVEAFTNRDPEVSDGLRKLWADQKNWPESLKQNAMPYTNPKVWEFIGKAMARRSGGDNQERDGIS